MSINENVAKQRRTEAQTSKKTLALQVKKNLYKIQQKFPDFSCELGKCTENPKAKVQAKSLHLLLQSSGQL